MAASSEMFAFIDKFSQMTSQGFSANLSFSSNQGRVSVSFNADLGYLMPYPIIYPKQPYVKPTQVRRRQRRAEFRKEKRPLDPNKEDPSSPESNSNEPTETVVSTNTSENVDALSANLTPSDLLPSLPLMSLSEDDSAIDNAMVQPAQSNDHDLPLPLDSSDTDFVACTLTSDPRQSQPHTLSTPSQSDDWSQKLYAELDAIFQIREDRYNSRMEDHLKSISENFYSKIKAKFENPSNENQDEPEKD